MFHRVDSSRLSSAVVEQVLGLISAGKLRPGDRLPGERELMAMLGVSRNSLREALRVLEAMAVVKVLPGKGTFINGGSSFPERLEQAWADWLAANRDQVLELLDVREALEMKSTAGAAMHHGEEDMEAIEKAQRDLEAAISTGNPEAMAEADLRFHDAVCRASGNSLLVHLLGGIIRSLHASRVAIYGLEGRAQGSFQEHREIIAAIRSKDPSRAQAAMVRHMQSVKKSVESLGRRSAGAREGNL